MNRVDLNGYFTMIFDCDGVVLNSNLIKTNAFYEAAIPYGVDAANALINYHVQHGGVSRYKKFKYFFHEILGRSKVDDSELDSVLKNYQLLVKAGLQDCEVCSGLHELRRMYPKARWLIASGGDQKELRELFENRGLAELFDGGIYGSPASKEEIVEDQISLVNIIGPVIFFGDSRYDYDVASKYNFDFAYVTDWAESRFCASNIKYTVATLSDFV